MIRGQIDHFKIENHRFAHWDWQDKTLYLSAKEEEESDQIQTYLFELQNAIGHLHTIFYEDTELLDETLETLRQGLKNKELWAASAQKNLRFFNEQLAKHTHNIEPIRI